MSLSLPDSSPAEGQILAKPIDVGHVNVLYRDLKLALEYLRIESIEAYASNSRKHPASQQKVLEQSIRAFGCVAPIAIDEKNVVVAGHGVLLAAKKLGYTEVPVIRLGHLGEAEKKALRIALNRSAELAGWDSKLLASEFNAILEISAELAIDFDLSLTGFSLPAIERLIDEGTAEDRDEAVEEPVRDQPAISTLGDAWDLGPHRIINGNACEPGIYEALLGEERAAAGLHDPPFNVPINNHVSRSRRHREFIFARGELSEAAFAAFLGDFLRQARAHSKPGSVQFGFMDWRHMEEMVTVGRSAGLKLVNLCIWDKGSGAMGSLYRSQHELVFVFADPEGPLQNNVQLGRFGRNRTNVWSWPGATSLRKELKHHPTPKPVGLLAEAIRDVSNRGDIVLDCFAGSGSSIIAAAKTGRRARAIELDPHYVDVAVRRWETWSGEKARHGESGLSFDEIAEARRAAAGSPADHDTRPAPPVTPVRTRRRPEAARSPGDVR